ncbi:MAG: hypothetical protein C0474_03130 [Sphingobium sp.]|nr:hypothetical protein [Sphingobium sp.]
MTIFRSSLALMALVLTGCGPSQRDPANEIEAVLTGNVSTVIARLEAFIAEYAGRETELEAKLVEAGFEKEEFVAEPQTLEGEPDRRNCQYYRRTRMDWLGMGSSAIVWLCEEGSGATFGYIAP